MNFSLATRRGWLALLGLGALALARPAWTSWHAHQAIQSARRSLARFDPAGAIDVLEPLSSSDRADVHYWLAVSARRAGRYKLFYPHIERAAEAGWPQEDIQRQRFLVAAQTGGMDAIEPALPKMLPEHASDEVTDEFCEAMVLGYLHDQHIQQAMDWLARWSAMRVDLAEPWVILGDLNSSIPKAGNKDKLAETAYNHALKIDPSHQRARLSLSDIFLRQGKVHAAISGYEEVLAADPSNLRALLGRAQVSCKLGKPQARAQLMRCLEFSLTRKQQVIVLTELGKLDLDQSDLDSSISRLTEATMLSPNDHRSRYLLVQALNRAGKTEDAEQQLQAMRRHEEEGSRFMKLREKLLREPDNLQQQYELAVLALQADEPEAGRDWLLGILRKDPSHRPAHERLAEYFAEVGEPDRARFHRQMLETLTRQPPSGAVVDEEPSPLEPASGSAKPTQTEAVEAEKAPGTGG